MLIRKIAATTSFVASVIVLAFAVWMLSRSVEFISEAIAFGQITIGNDLYEIISFYMVGAGQYVIFAILLFGLGALLCPRCSKCSCTIEKAALQAEDKAEAEQLG